MNRSIGLPAEVMSDDRQVYTPEEVARILGLHANTVYTMLKNREIPGIKAGRKWLISRGRFDVWLDGGTE